MSPLRFLISITFSLTSLLIAFGQSWSEVKESGLYFFGEGWGETVDIANQEALKHLIEQFSVNVSVDSRQSHLRKEQNGSLEQEKTLFETAINTYSQATLDSTMMLVISSPPNAHVGRWIKKTDVNKIFDGRRQKIYSLIEQGEKAVSKGKIDVALKCFYWAFTLVKSLPNANNEKFHNHFLMTWLPEIMDEVLSEIKVKMSKIEDYDIELYFTFKGKPINSLDFTYNDGGMWSNLCSAKDGVGLIFISPGTSIDNIPIQIEYEYRGQAKLDPEIQSVLQLSPEYNISRSFLTAQNKDVQPFLSSNDTATNSFTEIESQFYSKPAPLKDDVYYFESLMKIKDAIKTNEYSEIKNLFTPNGFSVFNKLVRYGQAKIVGSDKFEFTTNNGNTYGRGLQLSFSFRNGVRRNFVEDIVFKFNKDNLIENVSFGLGNTTLDDILGQSAYPENVRMELVEFLENYQTAFALKRLDYISTIFDEDAIIIVGTEVKKPLRSTSDFNYLFQDNKFIQYNRYDKSSYLEKLKRSFASKEYINLRFNSTQVRKASNGGELYGIQIEQDYYSSNYGDHGYLFLEINMNNPDKPLILVRTWQPQPDPQFGIYNESLFPVHSFE